MQYSWNANIELSAYVVKCCLRCVDLFYFHAEPENEILESFRAFDYQGSGTISASEFQTVMRNYGEALTVTI